MNEGGLDAIRRANGPDAIERANGKAVAGDALPPERPGVVPMDDAFIAIIAECRQAAQAIEAQARGALVLFIRQRGLTGEWRVAANGRELERAG